MAKDLQRLKDIFGKTDGYCHVCHQNLSFNNHGKRNAMGAWHIEHSKPRAKERTDHLNNLFAACIDCNIEKAMLTSRTARSYYGNTRAPYCCKEKKQAIRDDNTTTGMLIGGLIGSIGGLIDSSNGPRI